MWELNSQTASFYLYSAACLLVVAGCFFVLSAVTIVLFRRLRTTTTISWISRKLYLDWKILKVLSELDGVTKLATRAIPLIAGFALGYIASEVRHDYQWPVYEYHDVKVVQTSFAGDPFIWWMAKDDGDFKAPFCHDYQVSLIGAEPGNVAERFRYEDRGACWSIAKKDLGFWWKRDPVTHLAIKEINYGNKSSTN